MNRFLLYHIFSQELYLQQIRYNDFFNGFEESGEIESVYINLDSSKSVEEQFDGFFSALDYNLAIDEDELQNLVYGFHTYEGEYHIHKTVKKLLDVDE